MNNKTSEFNLQREVYNLTQAIELLKNEIAALKRVANMWPAQPPIFGPNTTTPYSPSVIFNTSSKGVWLDVPFDGYTAALHNRESREIRTDTNHNLTTTNFDVKSSPELLEALKDLRDCIKETK